MFGLVISKRHVSFNPLLSRITKIFFLFAVRGKSPAIPIASRTDTLSLFTEYEPGRENSPISTILKLRS